MSRPPWQLALWDRICVFVKGGARLRVYDGGGGLESVVQGTFHQAEHLRIQRLVMSLSPKGAGVMDFFLVDGTFWKVEASGALAEDGFDQRVRNVLTNS